jgi:glycerol-3-phosphate dehydrogenase
MVDLSRSPVGKPLKGTFTLGFEYSDCWVDDARLVVLNAVSAAALGADIRVRTEVIAAARSGDHWRIGLRNAVTGQQEAVTARSLINAAGAWAADIASSRIGAKGAPRIRLVRGSHIVVPRLTDHDSAYIFQNADRRVVFVIPYEQDYTLIGTTDVDFAGDLSSVEVTEAEVDYLCAAVNEYFIDPIAPSDVVWSYSGVRSLQDDGQAAAQDTTRDFVLALDGRRGEPPLLSIVGGKITTYRHVTEEALSKLAPALPPAGPPWTRRSTLPGGDLPGGRREEMARKLEAAFPVLGASTADRLARSYGTAAWDIFGKGGGEGDFGVHFGAGLYEREVAYLIEKEWAMTADDILWRRSKLGLRLTEAERDRLEDWLLARRPDLERPEAS